MQSKKINELATNVAPSVNDLTVIGDASTGQLKKITLSQIASLFGSVGGVSSVSMTVPTGLTVTGSPITTSGTLAVTLTAGYSIPTTAKQSEWDAGFADRLKWDGGASGLNAVTARTSLGLVIGTNVLAYRTFGSAANNNTGDFATAAQGANADTAYSLRLTGASLPLSISSNVISITQAGTSANGFLSSTDWNTFNGKQQALNGTGFVKASGTSITYDNSTYLTTGNAASTYLTISNASSTYLPLAGGTLTGALIGTSASFSGDITIGAASQLYLTSGDLRYNSNVGFGIVTQNGNRLVSIQNGIFGVNGAATINGTITAAQGIFSNVSSITNSEQSGARLIISNTGTGGQSVNLVAGNPNVDNTGFSIAYGNTNFLRFASNGAATFSSRVQITGNTAPSTGSGLELFYDGSGAGTLAFARGTGYLPNFMDGSQLQFFTSSTERMRITNGGNVGINETSPTSLLHMSKQTIWGTSTNRIININNTGTGGDINVAHNMGSITWYSGNSTPTAEIAAYRNTPASGDNVELRFYTAASGVPNERMRITSAGRVLIGALFDDGNRLQVNGGASFSGAISATNFGGSSTGTNTGDQTLAGLGGQPQLNGTGFVKASGTTISYDNSTYLTTVSALSTYLTLANAESTYLTISNATFTYLARSGGTLSGPLSGTTATFSSSVTASSLIRSGGTSTQFLKADGSIDSNTYLTTSATAANSLLWDNQTYVGSTGVNVQYLLSYDNVNGVWRPSVASQIQNWLGLGSNAYTSTAYLPLAGGTLTGTLNGTSASFSGNITIGAASLLYLTSGDLIYSSNAGFGIVTQNGNRLVSIQNDIFGVNGAATFSSSISATSGTFSSHINATSAIFSGLVTNYNVFNTQTSSYTLVLADASKIVEMNASSANTVTIPTNASVAFPIGTEITVMQYGGGVTSIAVASGVTIVSKDNANIIANRYSGVTLIKRATNEWYLIGNIVI